MNHAVWVEHHVANGYRAMCDECDWAGPFYPVQRQAALEADQHLGAREAVVVAADQIADAVSDLLLMRKDLEHE